MEYKSLKTNSGIEINGPIIIQLESFSDSRGIFFESWNQKKFDQILNEKINFVQDNNSVSSKGVLRGLHYQISPKPQGKLIRCSAGSVYDVAVDLRRESKTFGKYVSTYLRSGDLKQFWIPSGFAHGFFALEKGSVVNYKTTEFWDKKYERSMIWNDEDLNIDWPINKIDLMNPLVSKKDSKASNFQEFINSKEVIL